MTCVDHASVPESNFHHRVSMKSVKAYLRSGLNRRRVQSTNESYPVGTLPLRYRKRYEVHTNLELHRFRHYYSYSTSYSERIVPLVTPSYMLYHQLIHSLHTKHFVSVSPIIPKTFILIHLSTIFERFRRSVPFL